MTTDKVNIEDYRRTIESFAKEDRDWVFPNDGNSHAYVVFEQMFKSANSEICIAARSLCGGFTDKDSHIEAINTFLDKSNTTLKILISDYDRDRISTSRFFQNLRGRGDKVIAKKSRKRFYTTSPNVGEKEKPTEIHFCVCDSKMFRLEYDIKNRKAICNFNDTKRATELKNKFEHLFNNTDTTQIQGIN